MTAPAAPFGRRALGWGAILLFFLASGPIALYTYLVLTGQWQGNDAATYPSSVLLPFLMVFPYVAWCLYFLFRGRPGLAEHFLIVLIATPVLLVLGSGIVSAMLDSVGGFAPEDAGWLIMTPVIYLWQAIQYVVVQVLRQRQADKTVVA